MSEVAGAVQPRSLSERVKWAIFLFCLLSIGCGGVLFIYEINTFHIEAQYFSHAAKTFSYQLEQGSSDAIRFPKFGPYDIRLGYTRIPEWTTVLQGKNFTVSEQARWTTDFLRYTDHGLFPVYKEKNQAGLHIVDCRDREIFQGKYPQRIYPDFASIPPLVVQMLLFIENRQLLDSSTIYRNPAIEVERLARALMDAGIDVFYPSHKVAGGSTLATQIEKFRHSPGGKTDSAKEKMRQILSASFRSYSGGKQTENARKQIVLDYINAIPLSAAPGHGEVNGLGDGLWAWYGMDFDQVNQLLAKADGPGGSPEDIRAAGKAVRAVLSLYLSQRRPSYYLLQNRGALKSLTDAHLRLMESLGIISAQMRDSAMQESLEFLPETSPADPLKPYERKTANIVRARLLGDLNVASTYSLDRLDLTVKASLDSDLQRAVTEKLYAMHDPAYVRANGFLAPHLLETGDPAQVIYSFSLYENTPEGNALRVQTNTFNGPFNIDEQMKLDLGSTAKLRVLVHYLEIMTELFNRYRDFSRTSLDALARKKNLDPLSRWAVEYLLSESRPAGLQAMLDAAMRRTYSASPYEVFFTGGGQHRFANYKEEDNDKTMTVSMALRHSVNLVFIRLMRDIVNFHIYKRYGTTQYQLEDLEETEKQRLLKIFAEREGISFMRTFYKKYQGKSPEEARELLFTGINPSPAGLSAALRFLDPADPPEIFNGKLARYLPESKLKNPFIQKLYTQYSPDRFTLADTGFLARVHPLELWVVRYLQNHPGAPFHELATKSSRERQDVYRWLFKTKSSRKQYTRIRTMVELEAFTDILKVWKENGYPFDYLVPSYASAIGSSGDRPGALADLMGIILNDGVRYPVMRNESFLFGQSTPYETRMTRNFAQGSRVFAPEVGRTLRKALLDVVEEGTAMRLKAKGVLPDGSMIAIGGKTGTGDHRFKKFGSGGVLLGSTAMNRTAVFVFYLGDSYFGTITAYVPGKKAEEYTFSSSLIVKVLETLLPDLLPLFEQQDTAAPEEKTATM